MSPHVLERRQIVPGDLETVFGFFQDPMNLEAITPPWMHFEVVSSTDVRVRRVRRSPTGFVCRSSR
jgi:ligand-binding SRPBCC domain-containing protein